MLLQGHAPPLGLAAGCHLSCRPPSPGPRLQTEATNFGGSRCSNARLGPRRMLPPPAAQAAARLRACPSPRPSGCAPNSRALRACVLSSHGWLAGRHLDAGGAVAVGRGLGLLVQHKHGKVVVAAQHCRAGRGQQAQMWGSGASGGCDRRAQQSVTCRVHALHRLLPRETWRAGPASV